MVQYPRKLSFRVLAVAFAVGAGLSLLFAVAAPGYQHRATGMLVLLVAVADAVVKSLTPAVTVDSWGISWRSHMLNPRVDLRFSSVVSWSFAKRRLFFLTHQHQLHALALAHLSEANRKDFIRRLEDYLGAPERAAAPSSRFTSRAGRVRKGVRGALPPSGFQQWG